jgi:hypothetical protein
MRQRMFKDVGLTAGNRSPFSDWVSLADNYSFHAVNGYYAGNGVLTLYYQIAAFEDEAYVDEDIRVVINAVPHGAYNVFHEPLYILPNEFIRFYLIEEGAVSALTSINMVFVQKGRTA